MLGLNVLERSDAGLVVHDIAYRVADDFVHPDDYSHDESAVDWYDARRHDIAWETERFVRAGIQAGELLVLSEAERTLNALQSLWVGETE